MQVSTPRFKTKLLCTAISSCVAFSAHAQDDYDFLEEESIIVVGIRGSVEKSINDKRFASNVVDTINAEDIGKTTDLNIAEALSRITGVSAQTRDGEGTTVTVRGANPEQNIISLNGIKLGSSETSQAVDLSAFSTDILSKIEVIKTPSADHDEGSLGASIQLSSVRPLETDHDLMRLTLLSGKNDLADENNTKLSFSGSWKLFDDKFGVFVNAYDESVNLRKDEFLVDAYEESLVHLDANGNEEVGITANRAGYELTTGTRDRQGLSADFQFKPTYNLGFELYLSKNDQDISESKHGTAVIAPTAANLPSDLTAQENWHSLDDSTNTYDRYVNRFAFGELTQEEKRYSNTNDLVKLAMDYRINSRLALSAAYSSSSTQQTPEHSTQVRLQSRPYMDPLVSDATTANIQPAGYDCSSGRCRLVAGTGLLNVPGNPGQVGTTAVTSYNPDDTAAFALNNLEQSFTSIDDDIDSFQMDFDLDVIAGPFDVLEFGFKVTSREKHVDEQRVGFTGVPANVNMLDPVTGQIIFPTTQQQIRGSVIADGHLPADNFMQSLGYASDNVTDGWTTVSADKAFNAVLNTTSPDYISDPAGIRDTTIDTNALYIKQSFAFANRRLTGDVGLRYVTTDIETQGASGVNFHTDPLRRGWVLDPIALLAIRNADPANPCAAIQFHGVNFDESVRWARTDGLGFDTQGTPEYTDDTPLANQGLCYDANAALGSANNTDWYMWRHADISTEGNYIYNERNPDGSLAEAENRAIRAFEASATNSYNNVLPSLNLNYELSSDMVTRFAISKTMARPEIDLLQPGFSVRENLFGESTVSISNPQLKPLESNNLDLSFEWYANDSTMLSAGLFYKGITNFIEREEGLAYISDLRDEGGLTPGDTYDGSNLLLTTDDLSNCMPRRIQGGTGVYDEAWVSSDDLADLCGQFRTSAVRNGESGTINGLELQYSQVYTQLPGALSGLGMQLNYTFQDSQYDASQSILNPDVMLPELPVAYTPQDTYNATIFWEQNGHQIRLAWQATSDQLLQRSWSGGTLWQEGRSSLDLSATVALTDWLDLSLQATNLTDESVRSYYTSRFLDLGINGNSDIYDEGNPLDGDATTDRTVSEYKTGTNYRVGLVLSF